MAVERHEYSDTAVVTALSGGITDTALSASLEEETGWPTGAVGTFRIRIDKGLSTEEIIKCSALTGGTLTLVTRGDGGTVAVAHAIGAEVEHVFTGIDANEDNAHASDVTRDDHTQYMHNSTARTVPAGHNFTGAPTFSGDPTFSGNPTLSGTPHFTGTPTFDHMGATSDIQLVGNGSSSGGDSPKPARANHSHAIDFLGLQKAFLPAGLMSPYGGTDPPPGWLICDGTAVSRVTYHDLWFTIGTLYGAGDGVNTFNLPNMQGKVAVGSGDISHPFATSGTFGNAGTAMGWVSFNWIVKAS